VTDSQQKSDSGSRSVDAVVVVSNEMGLHIRAAKVLVETTTGFSSEIILAKDGHEINAKSILGVLVLAAVKGTELTLRAEGDDASEAVEAVIDVFEQGFYEG